MTHRVLFVDDQPSLLSGIRRSFRRRRAEWDMYFAESGADGLALMEDQPFDIVVSDMQMPGMDGAALLNATRERFPATIRFVLSGQCDEEALLRSAGACHQFISKPCEPEALGTAIEDALSRKKVCSNPAIQAALTGLAALPTAPDIHAQITTIVNESETDIASLARLVEQDPGLVAKLLQFANSGYFGHEARPTTPVQALNMLGPEIVYSLLKQQDLFKPFDPDACPGFHIGTMWDHSRACAKIVGRFADIDGLSETEKSTACLAALMHDIGLIILATSFPAEYSRIIQTGDNGAEELMEKERSAFGICHAAAGAYLLGLWGVPETIIQAARSHHQPTDASTPISDALPYIYVANKMVAANARQPFGADQISRDPFLNETGLVARATGWVDTVKEPVHA